MSTATEKKHRIYFENLDALRFFAFLGVFLNHSFHTTTAAVKESSIHQFVSELFINAELGVNFFFVLSGFLITFLLLNEQQLKGKIHIGYFYMRRFLRIWPLYFASVFFGFVIFPYLKSLLGQVPTETASPFLYITFLPNFDTLYNGSPDASMLGVLWSVGIEEQFYLIWPLLLFFLPLRFYPYLFSIILLFSFGFRYLHPDPVTLKYHTFSAISDMCVGGFVAYGIYMSERFKKWIEQLPKNTIALFYFIGVVLYFGRSTFFQEVWPLSMAFERLIFSGFFAFVVLEQCYAKHSLFKAGNNRFTTYWGVRSYGLYCLHFIGILIGLQISTRIGMNSQLYGVLIFDTLLTFILSLCIAWFSYRFLERPFMQLKKRFAYIVKGE